jgi:hypothetical protein
VTYVLGGVNDHLTEEQRQFIEEQMRQRQERQGRLLAVVEVRVYENEAEPQVSFPPGSLLKPESDGEKIVEVVTRAREGLGQWR